MSNHRKDILRKDILLGAYFTSKPHPQHAYSVQRSSFDYLADWYHSCRRLNLDVVLLHDELEPAFVEKYTRFYNENSRGTLHFEQVTLGPYTAADERFHHALAYLRHHPCEQAFMVDVSDAWFKRSPFPLVRHRRWWDFVDLGAIQQVRSLPGLMRTLQAQGRILRRRDDYRLFVGGETTCIGENRWMLKHFDKVYGQRFAFLEDKPVLNCGILGGAYSEVVALLDSMCAEMERLHITDTLNDMAVFNKLLHEHYPGQVYANGVLNSPWKSYLKTGHYHIFHK